MNAYGFDVDYGHYTGHPMDPRTEQDDNDPEYVKETVAQVFTDAIDAANPNALLPVDGPVKAATVATLLTWMSEDAAKLLLIACHHARRVHQLRSINAECDKAAGLALRAFIDRVAEEYADDNWEAA